MDNTNKLYYYIVQKNKKKQTERERHTFDPHLNLLLTATYSDRHFSIQTKMKSFILKNPFGFFFGTSFEALFPRFSVKHQHFISTTLLNKNIYYHRSVQNCSQQQKFSFARLKNKILYIWIFIYSIDQKSVWKIGKSRITKILFGIDKKKKENEKRMNQINWKNQMTKIKR